MYSHTKKEPRILKEQLDKIKETRRKSHVVTDGLFENERIHQFLELVLSFICEKQGAAISGNLNKLEKLIENEKRISENCCFG